MHFLQLFQNVCAPHLVVSIRPDCCLTCFKGALLGLRQFLATENSFKMMKNAFCFKLKAFCHQIFKLLF